MLEKGWGARATPHVHEMADNEVSEIGHLAEEIIDDAELSPCAIRSLAQAEVGELRPGKASTGEGGGEVGDAVEASEGEASKGRDRAR